MLYAGYLVSAGKLGLIGAVAAGVAGNLAGSLLAWWAGSAGGRDLILRYGRFIHVTEARLGMADRWFARYGERTVLIARCLPLIRTFISLPAGIAKMPLGRFATLHDHRLRALGARPDATRRCCRQELGDAALAPGVPRLRGRRRDRDRDRLAGGAGQESSAGTRRRVVRKQSGTPPHSCRCRGRISPPPRARGIPTSLVAGRRRAGRAVRRTLSSAPRQSGCSQVSCGSIAR